MGISASINQNKRCIAPFGSYHFGHVIGKGGFSTVRVAKHESSGEFVAMKCLQLDEGVSGDRRLDKMKLELLALKMVRGLHPNVINIQVCFRDSFGCYLGMDYLQGGDLRIHLSRQVIFKSSQVSYIIGSIGSALHFLHCKHILHRDVKPENIVLSRTGVPVLTDFGECHVESRHNMVPLCRSSSGSLPYLAPEVLTKNNCHSFHADFWSLGITMFELLFRARPFVPHCEKKSIKFSQDRYHAMWEYIEANNYDPLEDPTNMDWESILRGLDEMKESSLMSPLHGTALDDQPSPSAMPSVTAGNEPVTDACMDLFWGLTDVRIPQRLGASSNYSKFVNHAWFKENACTFVAERDVYHPSPFVPDIADVKFLLQDKFADSCFTKKPKSVALPPFPDHSATQSNSITHRLEEFECFNHLPSEPISNTKSMQAASSSCLPISIM